MLSVKEEEYLGVDYSLCIYNVPLVRKQNNENRDDRLGIPSF